MEGTTISSVPLDNLMYLYHGLSDDERRENLAFCHICLEPGPLTREHVPPRSAFNACTQLWDRLHVRGSRSGSRRVQVRGGFNVRTLCARCNSGVCGPYAAAYVAFVRHLVETPTLFDPESGQRVVSVPADVLRIAKQLAAMILAVEPIGFARHNAGLRAFVLDSSRTEHPGLQVSGFLVPDDPTAGTVSPFQARVSSYAPGFEFTGGEISMFPFGFIYAGTIGTGYSPADLADLTPWFLEADLSRRRHAIVRLPRRLTVIDSLQLVGGRVRERPMQDEF